MAMKLCTKLDATYKRGPIVFQGHRLNFKVTQDRKSSILTRIERFWTVTPVNIYDMMASNWISTRACCIYIYIWIVNKKLLAKWGHDIYDLLYVTSGDFSVSSVIKEISVYTK